MEPRFNFKKTEGKLYEQWEKGGFFNPSNQKNLDESLKGEVARFVIMMPPPNVTGNLHAGHGSMLAIQDLMARYARMRGKKTLYLPGTDHAAIATQTKVEKELLKKTGKTRHDFGRERFLERIEKFVQESKATIHKQIRKMGTSCDWSREVYTMDKTRSRLVRTVFKMMYDDGLIYRGKRLVNWCPRCGSTLADDEVEYKNKKTKLYWIKYGPFVLATTRPETKLGDTGVAVHPDDKRYKKMVGKEYEIPGVLGKFRIKVVADREVDPKFGSGAIKVTPAHSFIDNEIAKRHDLPLKQVINKHGRMMKNCGKYAGMTVRQARKAIVKDMKKMGLIDHIDEDYVHNLGACYRCGTAIEPLPSKQWFIDVDKKILKGKAGKKVSLKEKALEAVKDEEIELIPARFRKIYNNWLKNLHDWCISRQIWFGHRIPVWYCEAKDCRETIVAVKKPEKCPKCGGSNLVWDPDTLDTWFSSGTWTFSTLYKKPEEIKIGKDGKLLKTQTQKEYHPTSVLETGYDILFFWVARMVLMTTYAMNEVPFRTVYLHGLVRDKLGRKMSKSLENGIDPVEMIEKYGGDATRLALLLGNTPGNDLKIYEEKISGFGKFITKFWNIARFIIAQNKKTGGTPKTGSLTPADHYIFWRWENLLESVTTDLNHYHFSAAGEKLKDFTWNELADWYLEISKIEPGKEKLLLELLKGLLKTWHPFIPFVTEEIWRQIKTKEKMLIAANWPKKEALGMKFDRKIGERYLEVIDIIKKIRGVRNLYRVPANLKLKITINTEDVKVKKLIETQKEIFRRLTGSEILQGKTAAQKNNSLKISFRKGVLEIIFPKDFNLRKSKERLEGEIKELRKFIKLTEKKLKNKDFVGKAPEKIVKKEQEKLAFQKKKLEDLKIAES